MKHSRLYIIRKSQQRVLRESRTDEVPSVRLALPTFKCPALICLRAVEDVALFFTVHFESFRSKYLAAPALLQWVDSGELCLTERPLVQSHSQSSDCSLPLSYFLLLQRLTWASAGAQPHINGLQILPFLTFAHLCTNP